MDAAGLLAGELDRALGDLRDAVAIDVLHREHVHAGLADLRFLLLVEIADADEHRVLGQDAWRESDGRELGRLLTEERGKRHPVHVTARGRGRGVHVAVRVDPYQADRLLLSAPDPGGARRNRTRGQAVIAAEHQRQCAFLERLQADVVQPLADLGNITDVFLLHVRGPLRFRDRGGKIALVDDGKTERRELIAEAGNTEGRRPHVHTAASAAEVERNADDMDGFHRVLYDSDIPSPDGETIVVKRPGCAWMVSRNGFISSALFLALCATS